MSDAPRPSPATSSARRRSRSDPPPGEDELRVGWVQDADELGALAPRWDALVRRAGRDDPFQLSDFLLAWWRSFGAGRALCVAAVERGAELVGGLALYAERERGRTVLRYPGAEDHAVANRTELLAAGELEPVAEAVFRALARRDDWDRLELARMHVGQEELGTLRDAAVRHGHLWLYEHAFPGYWIPVPARFEDYLDGARKDFRKKLRRAYRRAAERGELELEEVRGAAAVRALLGRYVELSRAAFRARGKQSSFEDERLGAFFAELLPRYDELGILHAHDLRLAGRTIAIGFGYSLEGNLNDVLSTFDPDCAELMPGGLLSAEQLRLAAARGASRLDFYSGANPHKERWATRREPVHGILVGRRTLPRLAAHAARRAARWARRAVSGGGRRDSGELR